MALTAERVVGASIGILDAYGLADLTMRRVGDALGVKAGALYWHFPNKQSLLAAVSDEILGGSAVVDVGSDVQGLQAWASDIRARLLEHRDAGELVSSTRAMGLGHVDPARSAHNMLRARGASQTEADGMAQAFMHFVLGHVMEEQTQSQLARLGVVASFDHHRAQLNFDCGVTLLVAGVTQQMAQKICRVE